MTTLQTPIVRSAARTLLTSGGAVLAILAVWTLFIALADVSSYVAKSPVDVWNYLFADGDAAAHRAGIAANLVRTAIDAAYGFVLGLVLAASVSLLFYFSRTVESMFLPAVTALHAIPMVTIAPILVLIFDRGVLGTAVIGAAIVVVPALLTMLHGVRSTPRTDVEMIVAYGGSTWSAFRKVALPYAIPTWFAAARVAVTTSVVGALLAEWLATGEGLGGQMLRDANEFEFARLWASVVVLTVTCVVVYQIVSVIEAAVTARMSAPR
ncbi:ABC transporter permease [Mycolicibacterium neworleansense]|uniref:ABC transporter permease n=1 Tax=Mycolicibacterium neworleansense TaxID=146018 RepID=A0A0H5RQH7_9MYCO|nr:ABC transporter permease subunit [Mycolicibacterium neworleansense]MCV7364933.1 ABC transporter permease subunit [Mycolicibacterium neworleansense]CRZ15732.1 ABC transporter permease [Mycolicibacterium neworleansense]